MSGGKKQAGGRTARANKAWSGRFRDATAREVERFTESISVDRRLYREDIQGSVAHVRMLARQGILGAADAGRIEAGLKRIAREIRDGRFRFSPELEDIHMHVEARLAELVGEEAGGRLHTGRSRNDQVALDARLYVRGEVDRARGRVLHLLEVVLEHAQAGVDVILPGYTHLQKAQPVRLAHHLLAYGQMFLRDEERLSGLRGRVDVMPLGAGALAGAGYPVDPRYVAGLLGFARTAANSMDAVSDRDFAVEFCFCGSMVLLHLSRWAEELILWATDAFGFVDLPDAYCTGSSMMPQKKNPDVLELVRGKAGGVFGDLQALLVLLKGLPLTYNRDMQEDKGTLFHAADTLDACLSVFASFLGAVRFRADRMRAEAEHGFLNATDLADALARRGMPFRRAHRAAGEAVRQCLEAGKRLEDMTPAEWASVCPEAPPEVRDALALEAVVEARAASGGTARKQVLRQIRAFRRELEKRGGRLAADRARASAASALTGLPD